MCPIHLPRIARTLRAKILILVLVLSLASLAITGYFAFTAITDVGAYAQGSSHVLGEGIAHDSSLALLDLGKDYLSERASDQAQVTNVLFENTVTEMNILAAETAQLQTNAPITTVIPIYSTSSPPADPRSGPVLVFAPGATATPGSDEARTLSGLSDALKAVYTADNDMTSIYIATDSGMMLVYPGKINLTKNYDPRKRAWFAQAVSSDTVVWSAAPYVDADTHTLIMTCAKAVSAPAYGHWVVGTDISVETLNEDFIGETLGGKGYAVLISQNGDVISRPGLSSGTTRWDEPFSAENAFSGTNPGLTAVAANMTKGLTGIEQVRFNGTDTYVAYAPVSSMNWSLAISLPVNEITQPVNAFTGTIENATDATGTHIAVQADRFITVLLLLFIAILLFVLMVSVILSREIARPVAQLTEGAREVGKGNLDFRVAIRSGDEFEDLAGSFNAMAASLKENLENLRKTTADKERYAKEMEIAKSIQTSFLPDAMPKITGFDLSAAMIPAMEVGGDFYDIVPLAGGRWAFAIADVSGKGVSAALFMAMSRTLLRASLLDTADVPRALCIANNRIAGDTQSGMFVTVYTLVLDPRTRTLDGINAGHNPPILVRNDGSAVFFQERGMAMGVVKGMDIAPEQVMMGPGDIIVMYTDGVTEAFNAGYEGFGEERLMSAAKKYRVFPAEEIRDRILEEIRTFTGPVPQSDDITLVIIRVPG